MKRLLTYSMLTACALSLANCASEPPVIHEHHYYHTTEYVPRKSSSASVPTYKSAGVINNSPEGFQAVTPPSSYSQ